MLNLNLSSTHYLENVKRLLLINDNVIQYYWINFSAHSKSGNTEEEDDFKNKIYPWQIMSGPQGTTYYYNATTGGMF